MQTCDVLVAGGGPAGSACAWKLRAAGLDVIVADKAIFPRDKVCAGWITPQVVEDLRIDLDEYRTGRTFQPINGFRVGVIGSEETVDAVYDRPVSFGIRRCEFDTYLLRRSCARLRVGAPVASIRRDGAHWIVNETIRSRMLVGAGGHFCPIARMLNGPASGAPLIAAHEVEFAVPASDAQAFTVEADTPELYFRRDFSGYGWCVRKQGHLNIGFGHLNRHALASASGAFVDFLKSMRKVPAHASWYPQSGEGILPAIESGLMAASAIVEAEGRYTRGRLQAYETRIDRRYGNHPVARTLSSIVPGGVSEALGRKLIRQTWFVRRVVVDRWFLHRETDRNLPIESAAR
jgi:flavin-dependent dehydrogenase